MIKKTSAFRIVFALFLCLISLDCLAFNPSANNVVHAIAVQADGKIVIGGSFTTVGGFQRNRIARLHADGKVDQSFNPDNGPNFSVFALAVQTDGKIVMVGDFTEVNDVSRNRIARLNNDGSLDQSFNPGSGANNRIYALALQADGKIVIGGSFTSVRGAERNRIARFNTDGIVDPNFDTGTGANGDVYAIAVQADGKIVIGGRFTILRGAERNRIARFNTDGVVDPNFDTGSGANFDVNAIAVQADGKIVIGGSFTTLRGAERNRIARFNPNGIVDQSFDPGSGANNSIDALALQTNGKIVTGGKFTILRGAVRNRIARFNTDGVVDSNFYPGSGASLDVNALAIQTDGKIVIGGSFATVGGVSRSGIARLHVDGSVDDGDDDSCMPIKGANGNVAVICF